MIAKLKCVYISRLWNWSHAVVKDVTIPVVSVQNMALFADACSCRNGSNTNEDNDESESEFALVSDDSDDETVPSELQWLTSKFRI